MSKLNISRRDFLKPPVFPPLLWADRLRRLQLQHRCFRQRKRSRFHRFCRRQQLAHRYRQLLCSRQGRRRHGYDRPRLPAGHQRSHPGNYIVVNDVTGGGTVAAENVRNAKPDGLNLLAYHTGLCTSIASGQYAHDLSEFTICGMFITVPDEATGGLFVPGNSKFDKLEDLIAYGKEHPGELMAGMQNGSSTQLIEVLFEKEFDFQATMSMQAPTPIRSLL